MIRNKLVLPLIVGALAPLAAFAGDHSHDGHSHAGHADGERDLLRRAFGVVVAVRGGVASGRQSDGGECPVRLDRHPPVPGRGRPVTRLFRSVTQAPAAGKECRSVYLRSNV